MSEIPVRARCSGLCAVHCSDDGAARLLEEAFFLCQNGEYAPGGGENWADWARKAEIFLRRTR